MLDEEKMFDRWMTVIMHWYCTCFDEWSIDLLVMTLWLVMRIGHNLYTYVFC